jgi:hypothetical protein
VSDEWDGFKWAKWTCFCLAILFTMGSIISAYLHSSEWFLGLFLGGVIPCDAGYAIIDLKKLDR